MHIKALIIGFLFLWGSLSGVSQAVNYGLLGGTNLGSPVPFGNIPENASGRLMPAYNLGAFCDMNFTRHYRVEWSMAFSRKKSAFKTPLDSMPYVDKMTHPASEDIILEIETFFNGVAEGNFDNLYFVKSLNHFFRLSERLELGLGTYTAHLIRSNSEATARGRVGYDTTMINKTLEYSGFTRKLDVGFNLGFVYELNQHLKIHTIFNYGFNSLFDDGFPYLDYSVNNCYLKIDLAYVIGRMRFN